jgi:gamma-glutamylcyclotransferase (GGCT)/AIG2-like uncharacterized protein YtfP
MPNLFVYGTLRRGGAANGKMKGGLYLGKATTVPGYALGKYRGIPGMYHSDGNSAVVGDFYHISDEHLERLDAWEDSIYNRQMITVTTGDVAWAYLLLSVDAEASSDDWR